MTPVDGVSVTTTDITTGDLVSATTSGGGYYQTVFGPPATTYPVSIGNTLQIVATYGALGNTTTVTATGSPQQVDLILVCADTTLPVITNPQPPDGSFTNDNIPMICANYSDDESGIDTSSVVMTVNGIDVTALASVEPNYVCFTPPAQPDGMYTITVDVSDNCTNPATTESWSFTVDTVSPVINSVSLNPTEAIAGQSITVTVNATDDNGIAIVTAEGIPLTQQAGGDIWIGDITAVLGTNVIVNVTAIDVAGNTAYDNTATYNATVDTEDPVITSVSLSATTVSAGQSITVTVNAADNFGVVTVTADSASLSLISGTATSGTWTGTITAASTSGSHTVTVIASDAAGNSATDTSQSYTVLPAITPTISISTDKTTYSPGDTMNIIICLANPSPTMQSLKYRWWLTIPKFRYMAVIDDTTMTLPAGYDACLPTTLIPVGDLGDTGFGAIWGVGLFDPATDEIVSYDTAAWNYVPGRSTRVKKSPISIVREITKEIEVVELPN